MNDVLSRIIDTSSPKFGKQTQGTGKEILETAPEYINTIIENAMKSVTNCDFKYKGYRKLTVREEFNRTYSTHDLKKVYDIARSDIYPVELMFSYDGVDLPRYLYLPYCNDGNLIKISETQYHMVPVLSDTVISPGNKEVFVRLLRDKLIFNNINRNFIVNNVKKPGEVIYSTIFRTNGRDVQDNLGKMVTPISLYILGDIGLRDALIKYGKVNDFIVTKDDVEGLRDEYNIYESTKIKPRSLKETLYRGHDLKICINKKYKISNFLENFIFGIIYSIDVFPETVDDLISIVNENNIEYEKRFWKIIIGRIVFKNSFSVNSIILDIEDHFNTLKSYMDDISKNRLAETGYYVDTFFDLLSVILENYNLWLLNSKEHNSNIFNRYIDILYYTLYDLILGINRTLVEIDRRSSKKKLSAAEIIKIFNIPKNLPSKKIFSIVKSASMNISVMYGDYSGDLKYPKVTSILEDQSRGDGVKRSTKSHFPESTRTLKAQDLYFGSLLFLSKKAPSPRFKANVFLDYYPMDGKLKPDARMLTILNKLDLKLSGRADFKEDDLDGELAEVMKDSVDMELLKD